MNTFISTICLVSVVSGYSYSQEDTLQDLKTPVMILADSSDAFLPDELKGYTDDFFSLGKNNADRVLKIDLKGGRSNLCSITVESTLELGKEVSSTPIELDGVREDLKQIASDEIYFGYLGDQLRKLKYHNYDAEGTTYCEVQISSDRRALIVHVSKNGQHCFYFYKDQSLVGIRKNGGLVGRKSGLTEFRNENHYLSVYASLLRIEQHIKN